MSFISSLQEPITVLRVNPSVCLSTDQADLFYLTINISHNPAAILRGKLWSDASTASLPGFSTVTDRQQAGGGAARDEKAKHGVLAVRSLPSVWSKNPEPHCPGLYRGQRCGGGEAGWWRRVGRLLSRGARDQISEGLAGQLWPRPNQQDRKEVLNDSSVRFISAMNQSDHLLPRLAHLSPLSLHSTGKFIGVQNPRWRLSCSPSAHGANIMASV